MLRFFETALIIAAFVSAALKVAELIPFYLLLALYLQNERGKRS